MPLHFSSKPFILCNGHSPAEPNGPPGLQVRLHYIRIRTKKGRKARRREGDKCFFQSFFIVGQIFGLVGESSTASLSAKASASDDPFFRAAQDNKCCIR